MVLGHCSVLDNCSLGIHFSDFAHSHLVGGPHSHCFLVGLCNVHVLGLGTILGHSCLKIRFGQARERKQLQWRESFNVFSGVGFRCGSKRGKKNMVSMVSHTFG